eukprot:jgi/Pico_ML_1/54924/g61.t1
MADGNEANVVVVECERDENRCWEMKELRQRIAGCRRMLENLGVGGGDRVAVMTRNRAEVIELHFAAASLGSVIVNLNVHLVSQELTHILADAEPVCIVAEKMYEEVLLAARKRLRILSAGSIASLVWLEDETCTDLVETDAHQSRDKKHHVQYAVGCVDEAGELSLFEAWHRHAGYQMYYTSGTTGLPKGVLLSQQVVLSHAEGTIAEMGLGRDDVWGHFAPMFHLVDAFAIYAITSLGARHVVPGPFNANSALTLIEQERITCVNFASTMVTMMMSNPKLDRVDLSSMRILSCGGSPIPPANVLRVLSHVGSKFFVSYGMTECCGKISMSLVSEEQRLAREPEGILRSICTSGRPFALSDVRIVDDGGLDVVPASAQVGHVWVRGHTMFPGYWKNDSANATSFVDGWFCTGDMGLVNEDGYVTIVDRAKDMILCGGENVYCAEVEAALHEHPFVRQAAVIGVPNQVMGELVAAVLVVSEPVTQADIVAFCRLRLSEYKVPYVVEFVDQMPTTGSGKILKTKLRF